MKLGVMPRVLHKIHIAKSIKVERASCKANIFVKKLTILFEWNKLFCIFHQAKILNYLIIESSKKREFIHDFVIFLN
jgi:hypothetical protein